MIYDLAFTLKFHARFTVQCLVLMFVAGALAACDKDPDGTNEKIFYQSCNSGDPLVFNTVAVINDDGSNDYPVNVDAPLNVVLNMSNTGSTTFTGITIDVSIERYTDIFGLCSWIGIPTFGLTNNLQGCTNGDGICSLPPGITIFKDHIDLSSFGAIINILSTSEPYRLHLTFKVGGREISCLVIETKIRKG